jgi:ABC-2 type transport system permease protein
MALVDVTRLDLTLRRQMIIGTAVGVAGYAAVIVSFYPQVRHSVDVEQLIGNSSGLGALLGVFGSFTSAAGWLDANVYNNLFPLAMLLLTVTYGATAVAGRNEEATLGLVVALPLHRVKLLGQKVLALVVQAVTLAAVVTAVVALAGPRFDAGLPFGRVVLASLSVALLGVDLGLVAMAVGATTGRRGAALGTGAALAGASYLVNSLASMLGWVRPARVASVFYWSLADGRLAHPITAPAVGILAAAGIVGAGVSAFAFRRLDLR